MNTTHSDTVEPQLPRDLDGSIDHGSRATRRVDADEDAMMQTAPASGLGGRLSTATRDWSQRAGAEIVAGVPGASELFLSVHGLFLGCDEESSPLTITFKNVIRWARRSFEGFQRGFEVSMHAS